LPQAPLNDGMAAFQPGAVGIEIVFGKSLAPAQESRGGAGGGQADHGQQGGARTQDSRQDLPVAQLGLRGHAQGLLDAQLLGQLIDRPEGAQALGRTQPQRTVGGVSQGGQRVSGLGDGAAHGLQDVGRHTGQDSQGFGFDFSAHPEGLAQEDGNIGLAVFAFGDDFGNKHAYIV
jgi:hypothetical protein